MNATANTTDTGKLALAIRQTLENSGPAGAERQLHLIAKDEGDEALALIVQELRPVEVTALLAEGDFTKPSLISSFVSPEQFLDALDRLAAKWGKVTRKDGQVAPRLLGEVNDFLLSVILPSSPERKGWLIDALLEHELGESIVVALTLDHIEFFNEGNFSLVEKGTSQELAVEIAEANSKAYETIVSLVRSLHPEIDRSQEEEAKGRLVRFNYLINVLGSMSRRAMKLVETTETEATQEEVFVNLD